MQAQRLGDLLADGHQRVEAGHRLLEDHRHAVAAQALQRRLRQAGEVAPPAAAIRPAAIRPAGRGSRPMTESAVIDLPQPDLADQRQRLAAAKAEGDPVHRRAPRPVDAQFGAQALDLQDG